MRPAAVLVLAALALTPTSIGHAHAKPFDAPQAKPGDLDSFMEQVLARRDDNWKKLKQYILDEKERLELRGPSDALVLGQQREYTWFVREGYFIRSPVRFNGVAISESQRQKAEDDFLKRAKSRETPAEPATAGPTTAPTPASMPPPMDVQSFITQTREPQFISSAYFLQFKFEPGHYALVGREKLDNRDVLNIEYYPSRMFTDDPKTRTERRVRQAAEKPGDKDQNFEDEMQRLMNKVSQVTLWVEPDEHQIVKFTFDNAGLDFLPLAWLARVGELKASMLMSEAFPGVWLPKRVDTTGSIVIAVGRLDIRYGLEYSNYREATVTTKITGAVR
jgi:hypothetical protein